MQIIMTRTRRASQDCWTSELFEEGHTYDVADSLAGVLLRDGAAVRVSEGDAA